MTTPPAHHHALAILRVVLETLRVDIETLIDTGRHPRVVMARRLCVCLMRRHTLLSFPEISHAVNPGRGHSSCVTMMRDVERYMDVVPKYCDKSPRQYLEILDPLASESVRITKSAIPASR